MKCSITNERDGRYARPWRVMIEEKVNGKYRCIYRNRFVTEQEARDDMIQAKIRFGIPLERPPVDTKAAQKAYSKARRDRFREQGLCVRCGSKKDRTYLSQCKACRIRNAEYVYSKRHKQGEIESNVHDNSCNPIPTEVSRIGGETMLQ